MQGRAKLSPLAYVASGFSIVRYHELDGFMSDGHTLCPIDINRVYLYISFQGFAPPVIAPGYKVVSTGGYNLDSVTKSLELFIDKHFSLVQEDWHTDGTLVTNAYVLGVVKN